LSRDLLPTSAGQINHLATDGVLAKDRYPAAMFEGADRLLNGVEVALTFRAPLSWRLLRGWPLACLRVEIAPADVRGLSLADRRTADAWVDAVAIDQTDSGRHVRSLAEAVGPVTGPVLCTAQSADGSATNVRQPVVIFDAWHRAAAWIMQLRRGEVYPIIGFLVVTEHRVPLLGEE
jgi:hypothetical protein